MPSLRICKVCNKALPGFSPFCAPGCGHANFIYEKTPKGLGAAVVAEIKAAGKRLPVHALRGPCERQERSVQDPDPLKLWLQMRQRELRKFDLHADCQPRIGRLGIAGREQKMFLSCKKGQDPVPQRVGENQIASSQSAPDLDEFFSIEDVVPQKTNRSRRWTNEWVNNMFGSKPKKRSKPKRKH